MTRGKRNPMKILLFVLSAVLLVYIFYTLLDEKNSSAINESETNNSISKDTSIIEKEGNVNIEIINKVKSGDNLSVILKKHQIEEKIILLIDKQVEIVQGFASWEKI